MKVFLRHDRTGHFYNGNSEWVLELQDCRGFASVTEALAAIVNDGLDGMRVVVYRDDVETAREIPRHLPIELESHDPHRPIALSRAR